MSHYEPRRHKIGTYMISAKPASNVDHSDDYIVLWVSKNKVLYNVIQDLKVLRGRLWASLRCGKKDHPLSAIVCSNWTQNLYIVCARPRYKSMEALACAPAQSSPSRVPMWSVGFYCIAFHWIVFLYSRWRSFHLVFCESNQISPLPWFFLVSLKSKLSSQSCAAAQTSTMRRRLPARCI